MNEKRYLLIWFTVFLILPMAYQRTMFFFNRKRFLKMEFRQKTGLQIHHGHLGILFILISNIRLFSILFNNQHPGLFLMALSGAGWGLLMDEIFPHLMTKSDDRHAELDIYQKSFIPTVFLFLTFVLVLLTAIYLSR